MHNRFNLNGLPRKRLLLIILGSLLLLVVAGFAVFFILSSIDKAKNDDKKVDDTAVLTELSAGLKKTAKNQQLTSAMISTTFAYPVPLLKISESVWVRPNDGAQALTYFVRQESAADTDADYTAAINYLKTQGLVEGLNDTATGALYYAGARASCAVKRTSESISEKTLYSLSVACARVSEYAKQKDAALALAQAYDAAKPNANGPIFIQSILVQKSVKADYANATVALAAIANPVKVQVGKFYQVPGGQWKYLVTVDNQDKAPCNLFKTDEQMSAFQGTPCWDTAANAAAFVQFPGSIHTVENSPGND